MEWWLEWERKLLGTRKRFSSSKKALAFVIGSMWGSRVELNEERMIKVLFIMGKERE